MKIDAYQQQLEQLTGAQKMAVSWGDGPMLVLAGPGSGKTKVLTSRIARILQESEGESFRVLALTFTNKAADEMRTRAQAMCGSVEDRASIGTFHSFCMQMLQQHGSHIGVMPDFTIYSQDQDRRELLKAGLRRIQRGAEDPALDRYLRLIDSLKGMLVEPDDARSKFKDKIEGTNVSIAYAAYESELARSNALDFNSLIARAYQLVSRFDSIAQRYRKTYRYWLLDEFQDTNRAQYRLLQVLAGRDFKNIFTVADDDQIIYQWNGASFEQLQRFRTDFAPELIQLPTNFRCPAPIVNAANNLVRHNISRSPEKLPLEAGKLATKVPSESSILVGSYASDVDEAQAVASMIASKDEETWSETAVLARNKALLEKAKLAMVKAGVRACLAQRRDDFVSPQFFWLHAVLRQVLRPQDSRNFIGLVGAFNRWASTSISPDLLIAQAEGSGRSLLDEWLYATKPGPGYPSHLEFVERLAEAPTTYANFIKSAVDAFDVDESEDQDFSDDKRAWQYLERSIAQNFGGNLPLDQFLGHMSLQSKEPPVPDRTVTLMTIHAAKGKEFGYVFLLGLAEEILPSYQSLKAGVRSAELEEERRNCFVAITRTKDQLVLTWAQKYNGWNKKPSRFLSEMGLDPTGI
jgi:DNA helicase-2/ATP-dependent DNA helicase PcrA